MKKQAKRVAAIFAAASLSLFAVTKILADQQPAQSTVTYSTTGHGPSILLLHDSSASDQAWAETARELATRFEVTLVDITELVNDSKAVKRLRQAFRELDINDTRIAGSAHAEQLALRYALSYPSQSSSFILPHTSEDLEILADLINSTPLSKS
ncbi:hypothetical protein VDG1235_4199 [Verrucomicrobiia bacterium DG1235]|nr:hypothetical protein VDG1235_4199 [Verrucomicrobiae bacterium DG1235]